MEYTQYTIDDVLSLPSYVEDKIFDFICNASPWPISPSFELTHAIPYWYWMNNQSHLSNSKYYVAYFTTSIRECGESCTVGVSTKSFDDAKWKALWSEFSVVVNDHTMHSPEEVCMQIDLHAV